MAMSPLRVAYPAASTVLDSVDPPLDTLPGASDPQATRKSPIITTVTDMATDADQEKLRRRWPFQMVFPPGTFIPGTFIENTSLLNR